MANSFLDRFTGLLGRKKEPTTPEPTPPLQPAKPPRVVDYIKAWQLVKSIPIEKLGGVVGASSVIVFFAISGLLAWVLVFVKFLFALHR